MGKGVLVPSRGNTVLIPVPGIQLTSFVVTVLDSNPKYNTAHTIIYDCIATAVLGSFF